MKNTHCLAVMGAGTLACFILRLLQHLFIIDKDGFYTTVDMPQAILIWALYGVFALALVLALIILLSGETKQTDMGVIISAGSLSVLYIVAAVLIMVHSGISFMQPEKAPLILTRILAVSGVVSAIYFAFLGIGTRKFNVHPATHIFGLFPPIYVCMHAVCEFYKSFENAQMSETVMTTVSVCALALFVTVICLTAAGVKVTKRRMAAIATVYPIFASVTGPLFFMSSHRPATTVFAIIEIIFMLIAVIILTRLNYVRPIPVEVQEQQPDTEKDEGLDKYMEQIPDEEDTEEQNANE